MQDTKTLNVRMAAMVAAFCVALCTAFGLSATTAQAATISDGTYSVPYKVWNASQADQLSMMNEAVDGNAVVTVKNGKATYNLTFKARTTPVGPGHLLELWVFPGSSASLAASQIETSAYKAKVIKTFTDVGTDGKTKKTFNRTFQFTRSKAGETSIYVRVHVDMMEGFNQNARLAFNWSKAKKQTAKAVTSVTSGGVTYKKSGSAAKVTAIKKSAKSATIKATVKIGGKSYKVTSISASAAASAKKLTKVTIGKNIKTVGKKAFYKDSKLKTITFKGKSVKSIGSKAFKSINKKATVKAPKSKLKAYKKLVKKAGAASTVKYKAA